MTTSGSRRAPLDRGASKGSRVPAVLLVLVVVATGAGLAVAGAATTPPVVPHEAELTARPAQRQVVCPASDVASTSVVGLLPGADQGTVSADGTPLDVPVAGTTTVKGPGRDPLTVTATGEATRGVYATRAKNVGGGMTACSSPRPSWWFVSAGASPGHLSRLELVNPRSGPAIVDVTVLGADGAVDSPGLRGITIPSGGNRSLKLSDVAPSEGNLSIHVQASRGLVQAALDDRVLDVLNPAAKPIAEWIPDASRPTRQVVLSGLPAPGALEPVRGQRKGKADTLVLTNPGNREAVAKIRLSTKDGAFTPKGLQPATVPPESVVAVPLGDFVTNANTAVLVDADQPITAGYVVPGRSDLVHAVPAEPWIGPAATALPSGGCQRTLLLTAAGKGTTVTVTQYGSQGNERDQTETVVPGQSTVAVRLDPNTSSVVVTSAASKVSGSVQVNRDDMRAALPLTTVLAALRVPAVRPAG